MCSPTVEIHGASPAFIQWKVVRGDTAPLKVEFLYDDEITYYNTSTWTYKATAYDPYGDVLDDLPVIPRTGYVEIKAPHTVTENWGTKYSTVVNELKFDLQVTIKSGGETTVWTPVIGTICVMGDITPGGL